MVLPLVSVPLALAGTAAQVGNAVLNFKHHARCSDTSGVTVRGLSSIDGSLQKAAQLLEKLLAASTAASVFSATLAYYQGQAALDELRKINSSLESIANSASATLNFGAQFPQHVYDVVRSEIRRSQQQYSSQEKRADHYFFVFTRGTDWRGTLDRLTEEEPLPDEFCGFYHDLDVLCIFLAQVMRPALGPEAVFHILILSSERFVSPEPTIFTREIGSLVLMGELDSSGSPYFWMNSYRYHDQRLVFENIGLLSKPVTWRLAVACGTFMGGTMGIAGASMYAMACIASFAIPGAPLVAMATYAVASVTGAVSSAELADSIQHAEYWKTKVRIIGRNSKPLYLAVPTQ